MGLASTIFRHTLKTTRGFATSQSPWCSELPLLTGHKCSLPAVVYKKRATNLLTKTTTEQLLTMADKVSAFSTGAEICRLQVFASFKKKDTFSLHTMGSMQE